MGREIRCKSKIQPSTEVLCCWVVVSGASTPFEAELEGFTLSRVEGGHGKAHGSRQGCPGDDATAPASLPSRHRSRSNSLAGVDRRFAEQLESGSHTGGDLKLTSPNEVTALESTKRPRQLDGARGTTALLGEGVPPPALGNHPAVPSKVGVTQQIPSGAWMKVWVVLVPLLLLHPLAGARSSPASSNLPHSARFHPRWGHDGGVTLVPWEVATGLCGSTRAWETPATSDMVTSCFI